MLGCTGLTSITIPGSVTEIGDNAFNGCTGLTSITIPDSVKEIGWSAFEGCTGLTSITIGKSVKLIRDNAFEGCTGLTSITIGKSVKRIGDGAFKGCTKLKSITIPKSVKEIGNNAFYGCTGLTSVAIPESVSESVKSAFEGCNNLTDAIIISPQTIVEKAEDEFTSECRLTLENYVASLHFDFDEFDMEDFNGSYYTRDGLLSELFCRNDIIKALSDDSDRCVDEMSEEEISDAVANVALLLNQGSIKSLKITDGKKTLYEDHNDEPFVD